MCYNNNKIRDKKEVKTKMYYIFNQAGEMVYAVATIAEAENAISNNNWYSYYRYIG